MFELFLEGVWNFLTGCLALTLLTLATILMIWWHKPRLLYRRSRQDPAFRAEQDYEEKLRQLQLDRMALENEAAQIKNNLQTMLIVNREQMVFDALQRQLHESKATATPLLLEQETQTEPLPELLRTLQGCQNILIIGKKGSGKSNLIRRLADERQAQGATVQVLDPHAEPLQWGQAKVVGMGLQFEEIKQALTQADELRQERYKQRGNGRTMFNEQTYCIDEMTEITSEVEVGPTVQKLLNCRKVAMTCIIGGHSPNASDIGLSGKFNLVKNFDAHVRIEFNQSTGERRYWLCLNPMGHHDQFMECANPGPYLPPVLLAEPDMERTGGGQGEDSPFALWEVETLAPEMRIYEYLRAEMEQGHDINGAGYGWRKIKATLNLTGSNENLNAWTTNAKKELLTDA